MAHPRHRAAGVVLLGAAAAALALSGPAFVPPPMAAAPAGLGPMEWWQKEFAIEGAMADYKVRSPGRRPPAAGAAQPPGPRHRAPDQALYEVPGLHQAALQGLQDRQALRPLVAPL